eukprot:11093396-Alexandrium_andersonii.AAC.1
MLSLELGLDQAGHACDLGLMARLPVARAPVRGVVVASVPAQGRSGGADRRRRGLAQLGPRAHAGGPGHGGHQQR